MFRYLTILLLVLSLPAGSLARGVYQNPEAFLKEVFNGNVPEPKFLWLTGDLSSEVKKILGHNLGELRVRYWGRDTRTAWILEEIGKEHPITFGIVVDKGKIDRIKVLIYRESRGYEVRYPFFRKQFQEATLTGNKELDRHIDGISGATLSVRAMINIAELALYFHQQTESAQ